MRLACAGLAVCEHLQSGFGMQCRTEAKLTMKCSRLPCLRRLAAAAAPAASSSLMSYTCLCLREPLAPSQLPRL
eukprot:scaffold250543_cov27-Tisochrysis_lutea.AAC.3